MSGRAAVEMRVEDDGRVTASVSNLPELAQREALATVAAALRILADRVEDASEEPVVVVKDAQADVDAAWEAELLSRIRAIDAGHAKFVSAEESIARARRAARGA